MKVGDKVTIYSDGKPYKNGVIVKIGASFWGKDKAIVKTESGSSWIGFVENLELRS